MERRVMGNEKRGGEGRHSKEGVLCGIGSYFVMILIILVCCCESCVCCVLRDAACCALRVLRLVDR